MSLVKHFKNQNLVIDTSKIALNNNYKIALTKLTANNDKFKYRSEFPKGRDFWRTEYKFYVG
ncbi:hypothetical protein GCM10011416_14420 [Polaribacter pacificus]|uniref:Uncharacterized protein n=1 Tax=Polaribacter pacificus TaxID=1775173 RepID=A0A917HZ21_9FLAO|nr:hypothetical protein GCM10011416_14420 [Polaribacter pacificus]